MPARERVEAFIAMVVANDHVRAIEDFYTADASMQEPGKPPRRGRDVLVAGEKAALARQASVHTHPVRTFLVDGDFVVVAWTFDFTGKDGVTRRLEELALQRWEGDRIAEERFFYDTASAWKEVPAPGAPVISL